MKIFKKIKIDKTLISKTFLYVINPKKVDFRVIFCKTPPGGARGQIGSKFTFNVSMTNYTPNESSWHEKTGKIGLNDI